MIRRFGEDYSITIDVGTGELALLGPSGRIGPWRASLEFEGEGGVTTLDIFKGAEVIVTDERITLRGAADGVGCSVSFTLKTDGWLCLSLTVLNGGGGEIRIRRADFMDLDCASGLDFGGVSGDLRMMGNPRGMSPYAGARDLFPSESPDIYDLGPNRPHDILGYEKWNHSWMVTALWDRRLRRGAVMGAAHPMHESLLFLTEGGHFIGRLFYDGRVVPTGKAAASPDVLINMRDRPREGLAAYAELNRQDLRVGRLADYMGWNSFDYYANTETLADIEENAAAINALPALKGRVKWICVDSGWEYRWGEYYALEHRFPGGVPRLCERIREAGLEPGIWTAPIMVERYNTRLTRWDPDALVKDGEGNLQSVFFGNCYLVDPTHPAGERYLRETYGRLRAEGVRYFKCDFLEFGVLGRARFDREMSVTDANRRVLEIIREAVGPDAFILACIGTPESIVGLCDAARISGDMHNRWSSAQMSAVNTAWRWWMHGRLFWNDPDMLAIRGPETADYSREAFQVEAPFKDLKGGTGPAFSRLEAESWTAFLLLSGGLLTFSDRMASLNEAGRRIASIAAENFSQVAATPVDFYEPGLPSLYVQMDGPVGRLGAFNWYGETRTVRVHDDGLAGIRSGTVMREIWSGTERVWDGPFDVTLPAHGCAYYRWDT